MSHELAKELAPTGTLRAGINLSNFLLLTDVKRLPGARILNGQFCAVQQAVGTGKANVAGAAFLQRFVEEAKASGFVAELIARHHVRGLSVAPPC